MAAADSAHAEPVCRFYLLLYHLPFVAWLGLDVINLANAGSVIYASIFPSLIAPLLWMMAIQRLGPNRTSIFMNLMPVFTALIALVWLKRPGPFITVLVGRLFCSALYWPRKPWCRCC